ncbi:MAG: LacI family DNA-binding transcriptional regulator [Planctomycetaceae bacterium]|nr:LacI family DNA-binding transcriptional regulator [Planctomycetaceae bacterium]
MASIREVAREAGVSIATVSRVINGRDSVAPHLRRQVLEAVNRCEYAPAVGIRSQNSVALIYTGPFTPGSPYDSACIDGMVEAMRESPHDLILVDMRRDKARGETYRQFFARKGICGAILRSTAAERETVEQMADEGLPIVVLGDHFHRPGLPFVFSESAAASRQAIEHLLSLGHTRIAFAACEREDGDHRDRFDAYCSTLQSRGLFSPDLIGRIPPHRLDGEKLIRNLMGMPSRPTAVFIADPLVAVGAINEAHKMGVKIPEDLSIVGFDDTDMRALIYPKMTSVCQDSRMLGRVAFERLLEKMAGRDAESPAERGQAAWLEINETTAPPPEIAYHILPNRTRLATSPRHLEAAIATESPTAAR